MPAEHPTSPRVSLRRARLAARLPRLGLGLAIALLCLGGLKSLLVDPSARPAPSRNPATAGSSTAAASFAEAFVRAYLTWDRGDLARRERALHSFLTDDADVDAGLQPPPGRSQHVTWTAATETRPLPDARLLVTVAATTDTDPVPRYLAVTVTRFGNALAVSEPPSISGAPPRAALPSLDEPPLTDQTLADVVGRALSNWLTGSLNNLRADLTAGARVTPARPAGRLVGVAQLTWVRPGRLLAAEATVDTTDGARAQMRFLLCVQHQDRWFVACINNP